MKSVDKESFLWLLRIRPQWLIGKQIIHDRGIVQIVDISVSGEHILLEKPTICKKWVPAYSVGDSVVIDVIDFPADIENQRLFTAASVTKSIETLENRVGHPDSEQSKSLFDIVAELNKEMLELRLIIENMEAKEKNYEPDKN